MKASYIRKKTEVYNDRVTIVTLTCDITGLKDLYVDSYKFLFNIYNTEGEIKFTGKAIRAKEDVDNPILAERIAESRAKIKMYRFMCNSIKRIIEYYITILYGYPNIKGNNHISVKLNYSGGLLNDYSKYYKCLSTEIKHLKELLSQA